MSTVVEIVIADWLLASIANTPALTVTLCVWSADPLMSYILAAPAITSAAVTTSAWPWFAPIDAFTPAMRQLPPPSSSELLPHATSNAAPAAPAAAVITELRNSLRVKVIRYLLQREH
ncbi:MAG TPA: hypothetical protein VFD36_10940 [Kofleriaceae bacterium]|nr:hypothetical protein [Kofleriaceae bacterium]